MQRTALPASDALRASAFFALRHPPCKSLPNLHLPDQEEFLAGATPNPSPLTTTTSPVHMVMAFGSSLGRGAKRDSNLQINGSSRQHGNDWGMSACHTVPMRVPPSSRTPLPTPESTHNVGAAPCYGNELHRAPRPLSPGLAAIERGRKIECLLESRGYLYTSHYGLYLVESSGYANG